MLAQVVGTAAETVAERPGSVNGLVVQDGCAFQESGGVLVGSGDVGAGWDAPVQAGGVFGSVAVAQSPLAFADAHQHRVRVVGDSQVGVGQELSRLALRDDRAGELVRL
ncbi:hypothetical protein [Kitasatospora sp. NPDC017646]|uniref:hypothetical protein n=1 Tax=Kitasatospora sp. NPDC017646 TaxID=3364024 RepID=UPI00378813D4